MNQEKARKAHKWEVTAWGYPYGNETGVCHDVGKYASQREAYNAVAALDDIARLSVNELDNQVRFAPGEEAIYRIERIY